MITLGKNKNKSEILVSLLSGVLTIPYGMIFSIITGFKALEVHLVIKLSVWLSGIVICIFIVIGILLLFKVKKQFNYMLILVLTSAISATLTVMIGGSLEIEYFITLLAIVAIVELFSKILENKEEKSNER